MTEHTKDRKVDLVTMYLINNLLYSLIDEMSLAVVRTSFSPLARDAFDFQCALFKANGELILEGEGSILHSLAYCYIIRSILEKFGDKIHPGDIFLDNDPYHEASHLPDIYILEPIFLEGRLIAWACSGGHMVDVGGRVAGSCACDSTEIYQEGLRIPIVKFYDKGVPSESVFNIIRANSRLPDTIIGDLESHHAACHTGKTRLMTIIQSYGWNTLEMYIDELLNYAERRTREEIRNLPDGTYEFTDYLDDDGFEDKLIPIHLQITVSGDSVTYDFTGTSPQIKGSMNNPVGTTRAMILIGLRCMIDPEIPRNSGVWRPVKMVIPEGSLLNPRLPGACAGRGATLSRLMDVMMGAEAQIVPGKMPACESGADWLICMGTQDKQYGYTVLTETVWGGWGGRPFADGVDFCTPIFLDGCNQVCELNERLYPFMYKQYGYVPDTEGAGKYRGSYALIREWEFLGEEGTLQMRTERQRTQPWGLHGGQSGAFSQTIFNPERENYTMHKETISIKKGDSIRVITSGGGGWGNPLERDPEMVRSDVRNGGVTLKRASDVYGVVISGKDLVVDMKATQKLRERMKKDSASQ
jgi:N-methylhydantoinase B